MTLDRPAPFLEASLGSPDGRDAVASSAADRTVVFLDLSRFTALTDIHGDDAAAEVIDRFTAAVRLELGGRGRVVKSLGDGVLLDVDGPTDAIAVADAVSRRVHDEPGMPEVTGGISTGPVIDRDDDILGATVNLAARLADLAPAGELRVTDLTARAAAGAGWQVEPLGPIDIRGFHDPVVVFRLVLCEPDACVVDPVCGMRLTPGPTTPTVEHHAVELSFCAPACAARFASAPGRYLPGYQERRP